MVFWVISEGRGYVCLLIVVLRWHCTGFLGGVSLASFLENLFSNGLI